MLKEIVSSRIALRDLTVTDIEDYQRWFSCEQEWTKWDAPWELFDEAFAHEYITRLLEKNLNKLPEVRTRFEIYYQNKHIGWVTSYHVNQDKNQLAVGINIPEYDYWGRGLGNEAMEMWISYLLEYNEITDIYCETWSGNERMVKLALRLGFEIVEKDNTVIVNDAYYYRYKFRLPASRYVQIKIEQSQSIPAIPSKLQLSEEQIASLNIISDELTTDSAIGSITLDPYWPKWNSPWWKVLLLYETGYKHLIPQDFLYKLIGIIENHYLHYFPLTEAELPMDIDPYREIICFCALGNMYKVFEDCGISIKDRLPWWYEWLFKYQLPDGGYNCEEAAYTKSRKSSFLSTLPILEAMLIVYKKTQDIQIKALLDNGAQYLLNHNIYKSSTGKMIEADWLQISFPRYYDYDVLRGFSFIVEWAYLTNFTLPENLVEDCLNQIQKSVDPAGFIVTGANKVSLDGSLYLINQEWVWKNKAESFPALDMFCGENLQSVPLTLNWRNTARNLSTLKLI